MAVIEVRQTDEYLRWFGTIRDTALQARILVRIRRLSLGNPGDVRPVGAGVSEMRIDYGPGVRIYFVSRGKDLVILLGGGDKASQKRDISAALQLARHL